jgi:hypothetical protein
MNQANQGHQRMNPTHSRFAASKPAARPLLRALAVLGLAACLSAPAAAQPAPMLPGSIDLPAGKGAGVHGANSPIAPLVPRADVLPWSVLADVKTQVVKKRSLPLFTASQLGLNDKTQRLQGFMMPVEPGEKHTRMLLSAVPLSCNFCLPGGPESMMEVRLKTPVKYSQDAVVVEGRLMVLKDDPYGLYYRLVDAVTVK